MNYNNEYAQDLEFFDRCSCMPRCKCCFGVTGPTGATARCNKSSIYIFKW